MAKKIPQSTKRVTVPIVMLEGNFDVLCEHDIPVGFIRLKRYTGDDFGEAYVITINWPSEEAEQIAKELGFRTTRASEVFE